MKSVEEVTNEEMNDIALYMNDDLREVIHREIAPCTNEEFIIAYCNTEPSFEDCLNDLQCLNKLGCNQVTQKAFKGCKIKW